MLLLPSPKRLSTDIDIVVEPGTDVDGFIEKAGSIFPFTSMTEQERKGKNDIVKRHFKFSYDSPMRKGPLISRKRVFSLHKFRDKVCSRMSSASSTLFLAKKKRVKAPVGNEIQGVV